MWLEWLKRLRAPDGSTFLDDIIQELPEARSLDRCRLLWAEIARRFVHPVNLACRIAKVGDVKKAGADILDEALRGIGSHPADHFSRELVRIMSSRLDDGAVRKVRRSLYLRQFLSELPGHLIPYAEGVLNQQGRVEWLAEKLGQGVAEVETRCNEAFSQLPATVEREFTEDEVRERTDGVWTILMLKETL